MRTISVAPGLARKLVLVYFPTASPGSPYLVCEEIFVVGGVVCSPRQKFSAGSDESHCSRTRAVPMCAK